MRRVRGSLPALRIRNVGARLPEPSHKSASFGGDEPDSQRAHPTDTEAGARQPGSEHCGRRGGCGSDKGIPRITIRLICRAPAVLRPGGSTAADFRELPMTLWAPR